MLEHKLPRTALLFGVTILVYMSMEHSIGGMPVAIKLETTGNLSIDGNQI